jgi:hypothetical protein
VLLIADIDHASSTADTEGRAAMTQTLLRRKLRAFDNTGLFFLALTKF